VAPETNETTAPEPEPEMRAVGRFSLLNLLPDAVQRRLYDLELRAIYYGYRGAAEIGGRIPNVIGEPLASGLGRVSAITMRRHRRLVERHQVRAAHPTTDRALNDSVVGAFQSYTRYWYELFRLPHEPAGSLDARIHIENMNYLEASLARGKGTILALPHVGGWEYAGAWLAERGYAPVVVAERVEPDALFEWFVGVREAIGMEIIPLGPDSGAQVAQALRDNRIVCLLCDRDISGDGVPITFFDEATTMPGGPALMALRTGATILPVCVYFEPKSRHLGMITAPLEVAREGSLRADVIRITQQLAHRFEELIRAAPEQWHMMQPNWPGDGEAP
jgi:lauroyl/myristoyl acyltransferase